MRVVCRRCTPATGPSRGTVCGVCTLARCRPNRSDALARRPPAVLPRGAICELARSLAACKSQINGIPLAWFWGLLFLCAALPLRHTYLCTPQQGIRDARARAHSLRSAVDFPSFSFEREGETTSVPLCVCFILSCFEKRAVVLVPESACAHAPALHSGAPVRWGGAVLIRPEPCHVPQKTAIFW